MTHPYLAGFDLVKQHDETSGQGALAKCILSLYNPVHAFSMGGILGPLDRRYTAVVLAMVNAYAHNGETKELRQAGEWVYDHFPGLVALSRAMGQARSELCDQWDREREDANRRLYPNG